MNKVLELSSKSSKGGRRKIKMVLLTIHNNGETNLNGISWKEEYVLNNLDSIKGIPICASFIDENKGTPFDHGYTETVEIGDGKSEPLFNNSECCGVIEDAKIEDLEIDGETKRVLVGYGVLFYQRYKNFCDYIKTNILTSDVKSSIEIVGKDGKGIVYDGGYNENLRYPQIFDFSATAILGSVKEADENCYVLEVAQKKKQNKEDKKTMEFNMDEIKSTIHSTIAELNDKSQAYETQIAELNSTIEAKDSELAEKDAKISELNASVEQIQATLDQLKKDYEVYWDERAILEQELAKAKVAEKLGELDATLGEFNEDEKAVAKEDIDKLTSEINAATKKEDLENVTSEINSIKSKICMNIVESQKKAEADAKIAEQNSVQNEDVEDIFSEVCSTSNEAEEDTNIF